MDENFTKAFKKVMRAQLAQNKEVHLKGVGTFRKEHCKQDQQLYKDGRVMMVPPKDVITFTPEKEKVYG